MDTNKHEWIPPALHRRVTESPFANHALRIRVYSCPFVVSYATAPGLKLLPASVTAVEVVPEFDVVVVRLPAEENFPA